MDTRERTPTDQPQVRPTAQPGAGDSGQVRAEAGRLAAAADEAIRRALSRDSFRFLQENRQQGGQ